MSLVNFLRHSQRILCLSLALVLTVLLCSPVASSAESKEVIVGLGDVHGNFDGLCDILERVGLINEAHHWIGGRTTLVQTGDMLDRGPRERDVMDLLMLLESESLESGGRVEILLGNHEIMNIMGDLRYATPQIFASFATPDSEALRKASYDQFTKWLKQNSDLFKENRDPLFAVTEAQWMENHPVGFVEQRATFARNGAYGNWIRQHFAVFKADSIVFVHGGIAPEQSRLSIDQINSRVRSEIRQWDEMFQYLLDRKLVLPFFTLQETTAVVKAVFAVGSKARKMAEEPREKLEPFLSLSDWLCLSQNGPLWYRGYDTWTDQDGAAQAEIVLRAYGAAAVVVGHTVQKTLNIRSRFNGKIFLIDTGMVASAAHAGRPSALRIDDDTKFTAMYLDSEDVLYQKGSGEPAKAQ